MSIFPSDQKTESVGIALRLSLPLHLLGSDCAAEYFESLPRDDDFIFDAFSLVDGSLIEALNGINSFPLVNDGLWGLSVGNGGNGGLTSALYITAGPNNESGRLFARIDPTTLTTTAPEPSTILLLGIGVLAIALQGPRARRSSGHVRARP
ncbi:MAG: PEP-CTERM sorting domain-containing protein [Burkholderiaceae bacterium]